MLLREWEAGNKFSQVAEMTTFMRTPLNPYIAKASFARSAKISPLFSSCCFSCSLIFIGIFSCHLGWEEGVMWSACRKDFRIFRELREKLRWISGGEET